jgi:hypothetical protein
MHMPNTSSSIVARIAERMTRLRTRMVAEWADFATAWQPAAARLPKMGSR